MPGEDIPIHVVLVDDEDPHVGDVDGLGDGLGRIEEDGVLDSLLRGLAGEDVDDVLCGGAASPFRIPDAKARRSGSRSSW